MKILRTLKQTDYELVKFYDVMNWTRTSVTTIFINNNLLTLFLGFSQLCACLPDTDDELQTRIN